jgi:hypothetical protein
MFFGIILGIILTVGAAYVYDSVRKTSIQGGIERPVVNWDVVNRGVKTLVSSAQASWARLTGHAKDS